MQLQILSLFCVKISVMAKKLDTLPLFAPPIGEPPLVRFFVAVTAAHDLQTSLAPEIKHIVLGKRQRYILRNETRILQHEHALDERLISTTRCTPALT
jgi:hypothetical protein